MELMKCFLTADLMKYFPGYGIRYSQKPLLAVLPLHRKVRMSERASNFLLFILLR